MQQLIVTTPRGETHELDYVAGMTAMEVIRNAGLDDLLALCGGVCSCATCHVRVDPAFANLVPAITEDEDGLLEGANRRDDQSRLSCQIRLTAGMTGLRLTIVESD